MSSLKLPAHEHTLFLLDTSKLFAMKGLPYWGCDACKRISTEMQVTHSYRCMSCDFDVCKECCESVTSLAHEHKLVITNAKLIYPNGAWCCDNCRTDSRSQGQ